MKRLLSALLLTSATLVNQPAFGMQQPADQANQKTGVRAKIQKLAHWVTQNPGIATATALVTAALIGGTLYWIYQNPDGAIAKVVKSPWTSAKQLGSWLWNSRRITMLKTTSYDSVHDTTKICPTSTVAQHTEELLNQAYATINSGIRDMATSLDKFTHTLNFAQHHGVTSDLVAKAKGTLEILQKTAAQQIVEGKELLSAASACTAQAATEQAASDCVQNVIKYADEHGLTAIKSDAYDLVDVAIQRIVDGGLTLANNAAHCTTHALTGQAANGCVAELRKYAIDHELPALAEYADKFVAIATRHIVNGGQP